MDSLAFAFSIIVVLLLINFFSHIFTCKGWSRRKLALMLCALQYLRHFLNQIADYYRGYLTFFKKKFFFALFVAELLKVSCPIGTFKSES